MDDTHRTQRILSGRFIAGAALPYTDEHGIVWSLDFSDVKGITRRMVQAEARATADLARLRALEEAHEHLARELALAHAEADAATERVQHLLTTIDVERTGRKEAEEEVVRLTTQADTLARLATSATYGWACFARRKAEFDGIAKLHDDIDAALHAQDTEVGR